MHDEPRKLAPIDPFLSAKRVPIVLASLRVDDVLSVAPHLTKEQAADLLMTNAPVIAHLMLTAGTAAALQLVEGGGDGN
jgi:hypothetical protein